MPSSLVLALLLAAADPGWKPAAPGHAWSFPSDHWSHPGYRNEWWYFTGILSSPGAAGGRTGASATRSPSSGSGSRPRRRDGGSAWSATDVLMGHVAVTDLGTGERVFTEVIYRAVPAAGGIRRGSRPAARLVPGTAGDGGAVGAPPGRGRVLDRRGRPGRGLSLRLRLRSDRRSRPAGTGRGLAKVLPGRLREPLLQPDPSFDRG